MTLAGESGSTANAAPGGLAGLLDELRWRGMLQGHSAGLAERLALGGPIKGYNGFDPTGPSLHIGNLVPIFGLIHLQRAGGTPVILVGGGTAMIGDPSGRSSERNLLPRSTIEENIAGIRRQLEHFVDFSGSNAAFVVDNYEWLSRYSLLEFLRDVGKYFTVPYMLAKDSVQVRLEGGLSFTEFSYMLLQAADFLHLYGERGVEMQMGGADQWGNITAGLELIRRRLGTGAEGRELAYAMSYPLLTNESGSKFGKTAAGTSMWLDPNVTSPYEFYQYWFDADDRDVARYLRTFTLFDRERIETLEAEQAAHPELRPAQRALAFDITARVHGTEAAERARATSEAVASPERSLDPAVLPWLAEALGSVAVEWPATALALGVASGTYASNGEVRRAIAQGGFTINGVRITDPSQPAPEPIAGEWMVLRAGRKRLVVGRVRAG